MRSYILATFTAAFLALPAAAVPAPSNLGDGVLQVQHREYHGGYRHWGYGPDCRELRRACLNKEELGEVGRGNCQRYRAMCR
jgi:hypothetical protein